MEPIDNGNFENSRQNHGLDPSDPYAREQQTFPFLTSEEIDRVRQYGREESVSPGTYVFKLGERSVDFFVVLEGAIEIVEHDPDGSTRVNTAHRTQQFTGELDLFNNRRILVDGIVRGATVDQPGRLLRVPRHEFRRLISAEPELGEKITRAFILRRTGFIQHGEAGATLIASHEDADAIRMARFLNRNGYPLKRLDPALAEDKTHADALLNQRNLTPNDLPVVLVSNMVSLSKPSNKELAIALGLTEDVSPDKPYDVIVVGAGPAGLSTAVYAASEGLSTLIIEQEAPGGQAGTSSKIENYLGFPTGISGPALAGRAWIQSQKFGAQFAVSRKAVGIECEKQPFRLGLDDNDFAFGHSVVLATGARYRKLGLAEEDSYENRGLYYAASALEAKLCENSEVVVVGGGNSAGQAAVFLSGYAKRVHMLIRGQDLSASMSDYLIQRIAETDQISLHGQTEITDLHGDGKLVEVTWKGPREEKRKPISHVFVMIGAIPNTGWLNGCVELDRSGFVCTGTDVTEGRATSAFETSRPGVFAVGDVRAGSIKRVASSVGEGSVCVASIHSWLSSIG